MTSILDAGFLYALVDRTDIHSESVIDALQQLRGRILLPVIAITETAYLIQKRSRLRGFSKIFLTAERVGILI